MSAFSEMFFTTRSLRSEAERKSRDDDRERARMNKREKT